MATVKITRLEKEYRGVRAIRGIDLEIKDGEFVVLVGPSGCGKSTLLGIVAGLYKPSSGSVMLRKEKTGELEEGEIAEDSDSFSNPEFLRNQVLPYYYLKCFHLTDIPVS